MVQMFSKKNLRLLFILSKSLLFALNLSHGRYNLKLIELQRYLSRQELNDQVEMINKVSSWRTSSPSKKLNQAIDLRMIASHCHILRFITVFITLLMLMIWKIRQLRREKKIEVVLKSKNSWQNPLNFNDRIIVPLAKLLKSTLSLKVLNSNTIIQLRLE